MFSHKKVFSEKDPLSSRPKITVLLKLKGIKRAKKNKMSDIEEFIQLILR